MREGDCWRTEDLEPLWSGHGGSDWREILEGGPPDSTQWGVHELGCVALTTVSFVAVDGNLEFLWVRQILHLTFKWVEVLDIPTEPRRVFRDLETKERDS